MLAIMLVEVIWIPIVLLVNLLPTWTPPSSIAVGGSAYSGLATIGTYASGLQTWIPFEQYAIIISAMLAVMVLAGLIFVVRRVGATVPFVGRLFDRG